MPLLNRAVMRGRIYTSHELFRMTSIPSSLDSRKRSSEPKRAVYADLWSHLMKAMLGLISMLVSLSMSTLTSASSYVDCPGVQKGTFGGEPAWYSACSMRKTESASIESHFVMYLDSDEPAIVGPQVRVTFKGKESLTPSPTSDLSQGVWSTFGVEKMPESYAGTCEEVTSTDGAASASEGVYCGVANSESGERLLIKATVNKGDLNDGSVQRKDDSAGAAATSVPVSPAMGFFATALLMLAWGLRSLRQEA